MEILLLFSLLIFVSSGNAAPAKSKEAWGYVNVRPNAYMFWWLYYTNQTENYANYPIVIWLQGGPGSSSTGFGNFMEIGPLDVNLKPRNSTWLSKANLLFIDNPVGTGYSYVTNKSALATTNKQIAADLLVTLTSVLDTVSEFQNTPLFIFGESYGGKMAADFAIALSNAIKNKSINCNFKGIALGDSWISPLDSVFSWGSYLYGTSLLNKNGWRASERGAYEIKKSLVSRQFRNATEQFGTLQEIIGNYTHNVDWYNILKNEGPQKRNNSLNKFPAGHPLSKMFDRLVQPYNSDQLFALMNGPIRIKLHDIPENVTWQKESSDVFDALSVDFMKPVIDSVDEILSNYSYVDVNIYNGQLDLIVDTIGTLQWVQKLQWPGVKRFFNSTRKVIPFPGGRTGGFVQSFKQLSFFWIMKAGHMVPSDAPETALKMLDMILTKKK